MIEGVKHSWVTRNKAFVLWLLSSWSLSYSTRDATANFTYDLINEPTGLPNISTNHKTYTAVILAGLFSLQRSQG